MTGPRVILGAVACIALIIAIAHFSSNRHTKQDAPPLDSTPSAQSVTGVPPKYKSKTYQHILKFRDKHRDQSALLKDKNDKTESIRRFQSAMQVYESDIPKTKQLLTDALELDRDNTAAMGILAGIYLNEGNREGAVKLATECLAIDRKSRECHTTLISSFTRFGEFEESYNFLQDCLAEDSTNVHCLGGIETYYLNNGQLNEAKQNLDRIIQLEPDSIWTYLAMGQYFDKAGDSLSALAAYRQACNKKQPFACKRVQELEESTKAQDKNE